LNPAVRDSWAITIKPRAKGLLTVVGTVEIHAGDFVDEGEFMLSARFGDGVADVDPVRPVREERIRDGQRFRFGGPFMVPIDSAERIVQRDIDPVRGKPQALDERVVIDSVGTTAAHEKFVVFVDAAGRVRDARPVEVGKVEARRNAVVRRALTTWRFRPATANGKAVADWVIVDVPIVPIESHR
jgi:hypothetical protein